MTIYLWQFMQTHKKSPIYDAPNEMDDSVLSPSQPLPPSPNKEMSPLILNIKQVSGNLINFSVDKQINESKKGFELKSVGPLDTERLDICDMSVGDQIKAVVQRALSGWAGEAPLDQSIERQSPRLDTCNMSVEDQIRVVRQRLGV